jgi:hypothetical protein
LSHISFIIWIEGMFLLFLLCSEPLSWRDAEFCQRLFFLYWDDHLIFFPLFCLCAVLHFWFANVEPSLYAWMNPTWSWFTIFLNVLIEFGLQIFYWVLFIVLWCAFRFSCLKSRSSVVQAMPPVLFVLVILDNLPFLPKPA